MIFHDPAKFGGHRHCSSSDIIFLNFSRDLTNSQKELNREVRNVCGS